MLQVEREAKICTASNCASDLVSQEESLKYWHIFAAYSITQKCTLRIGKAHPISKYPGSSLF